MSKNEITSACLSPALEDYLETIWNILQESKVARVKDIAELHGVRAASVTPALKRLDKLGLVAYAAREYVELSAEGETLARRVKARHDLIMRFLTEVLGVSDDTAMADACAAEHVLSDETIDRLVRLFEYLQRCGDDQKQFISDFRSCSAIHPEHDESDCTCSKKRQETIQKRMHKSHYIADMDPGSEAIVAQVHAPPERRGRLIDRGLLPGVRIHFVRVDPDGETVVIRLDTEEQQLTMDEAASVIVTRDPT